MLEEVIGFSVRHKRRALCLACPCAPTCVLGLTDVSGSVLTQEAVEFIEGNGIPEREDGCGDKCVMERSYAVHFKTYSCKFSERCITAVTK